MILIGLGSSLAFWGRSPQTLIPCAVHALSRVGKAMSVSRLYVSPAFPDPSDPVFVNACVRLETNLAPQALLAALHAIEAGFGRRRERPNGPRTLDLDLLDYEGLTLNCVGPPALTLPHPRLAERDFVLFPIQDVAADWRHPSLQRRAGELISDLPRRSARRIGAGDGPLALMGMT